MGYAQRLPLDKLQAWENLGYGMFLHFGLNTYYGEEYCVGAEPSSAYAPDGLDVDQWIRVARDAGMKYAVLTTKHVAGHCLWPSKYTGYSVETAGDKTDVVGEFVKACAKYGLMPGFYYCSWDNHNLFGSVTPTMTQWDNAFTTEEYRAFQTNQLTELLTQYGNIGEVWVDIPKVLPRDYRQKLYDHISALQPDAVIMMNNGIGDGSSLSVPNTWPTDIMAIERFLPSSYQWQLEREIEGRQYYIPGEVCDPICREWFYVENDQLRSDEELLGMYLVSRARRANFLLNVPPDKHGVIPQHFIDALTRLKTNIGLVSKL